MKWTNVKILTIQHHRNYKCSNITLARIKFHLIQECKHNIVTHIKVSYKPIVFKVSGQII